MVQTSTLHKMQTTSYVNENRKTKTTDFTDFSSPFSEKQAEPKFTMGLMATPDPADPRIFGSKTFVHIPDVKRKKLDPENTEGILVGYCELIKGLQEYIPSTRKIQVSPYVIISTKQ